MSGSGHGGVLSDVFIFSHLPRPPTDRPTNSPRSLIALGHLLLAQRVYLFPVLYLHPRTVSPPTIHPKSFRRSPLHEAPASRASYTRRRDHRHPICHLHPPQRPTIARTTLILRIATLRTTSVHLASSSSSAPTSSSCCAELQVLLPGCRRIILALHLHFCCWS
jgi:hypothetical protein